jgi:hypothetical protein
MRYKVLKAASMKMAVIWDVAPCHIIQTTFARVEKRTPVYRENKYFSNAFF